MFCNKCRTENADGARFCTKCAADLSKQTPGGSPDVTLSGKATLLPGQIVSGMVLAKRYEIVGRLGSGGMGEVYKALDNEMDGMPVAIKVLPPILAGNKRAVTNLKREAAISLKLAHPNICRLHTFSSDGDVKFLVMECIEGKTLEELLDAKDGRKLPVDEVLPIARQVAEALDHAHGRQPPILHRDIKPSNIMITPDGNVKVLDFGIAREAKDSMTRVTGKETSGTLLYMSPEQFNGERLGPASDIYSFAVTLYECFSGHPPFWKGSIGHQLLNKQPAEIAQTSKAINDVIQAALAKDPGRRPSSASELVRTQGKQRPNATGQVKTSLRKKTKALGALCGKVWNLRKSSLRPVVISAVGAIAVVIALAFVIESTHKPEKRTAAIGGINNEALKSQIKEELFSDPGFFRLTSEQQDKALVSQIAEALLNDADFVKLTSDQQQEAARTLSRQMIESMRQRRAATATIPVASRDPWEEAYDRMESASVPRNPKLGDSITNSIGMNLVYIPPTGPEGFLMGSPATEDKRDDDERQQHRVILTKGFWIGTTEVTQQQWKSVMGTTLREQRDRVNPVWPLCGEGPDYPMYYVSWEEAVQFCQKLSAMPGEEGRLYRLPTEAEWEYACRAGTTGRYAGTGRLEDMGWYSGNNDKRTHPVGKKRANAWGLYDMHGNVWEWCSDWYGKDYLGNRATDPPGARTGEYRVLRGGGWCFSATHCESGYRSYHASSYVVLYDGFRVALNLK